MSALYKSFAYLLIVLLFWCWRLCAYSLHDAHITTV